MNFSPDGGIYTTGCTTVTGKFMEDNSRTIGGVVIGTMGVQLVAICLAIFLYFVIAWKWYTFISK